MPLAGSRTTSRAVETLWDARRAAHEALDEQRAEHRARRSARPTICAMPSTNWTSSRRGRRGDRARRRAAPHDAGREDRRAICARRTTPSAGQHSPVPALAGGVRRLERRARAGAGLVEPAVKALDAALNALEEADQHLEAALRAADFDPAELERIEERLFALRAAARKYIEPVDELAALAAKYAADLALIDAGAEQLKALEAAAAEADERLRAAADEALGGAQQGRRRSSTRRSTPNWRRSSSSARTSSTQIETDAGDAGPAGHRPRRVLGADQSRHAAGPDDEGRLRRRTGALPAGAEGRAGRSRLGADAGVRRDRHRRRRRGGRCHRRAAGAARRHACRCWR